MAVQARGAVKQHKEQTHEAVSLFPIDWSLGLGGHWRAKVCGWLHERRVTEGGARPGEVRPVVRLRHVVVGDVKVESGMGEHLVTTQHGAFASRTEYSCAIYLSSMGFWKECQSWHLRPSLPPPSTGPVLPPPDF